MDGVPPLYEQSTRGAASLEGLISLLTAGAAPLINVEKWFENVRYSLNEISQDVKPPGETGSTKSRQRGLH